ncbi:MAG: 2-amino-4-hydroxy-6-hydroxymethyldihydropteridine diphosphokinase, partial [Acidimicrobiia bacterium]
TSSLYETAPVGGPDQDPYLNAVGLIETTLSAQDLLAALHEIEAQAGRVRQERWGPRTLDLDLVVYDDLVVDGPDLELPHPRAHERRFVLAPLVEVWPDASLRSGTARAALDNVSQQKVALLAADWGEGVPRFLERGGGWVTGQALLLALWAVAFVTTAQFPPRRWMWAGLLPVAVGVWMALAAMPLLGRGFTPFPAPSPSGRLTTTGPYGWVRHPIYGGILLVVIGSSVLGGSWWAVGAATILGVLLYLKSGHEERFLRIAYSDYADYSRTVSRRLLPGII